MENIIIGITYCKAYRNYEKWIKPEPGVEPLNLSYIDDNLHQIEKCDGIILSGGQDVHPRRYSKGIQEDVPCEAGEIEEARDEFEWKVLQYALNHDLPVLGICRGLQLCNVFLGGTLVMDIPSSGKPDHSRKSSTEDRRHMVTVAAHSLLHRTTGELQGEVNSAHHQCADILGEGLVVSAVSEDGIIEALERKNPDAGPFLLLVQWHPERMTDLGSPFSSKIKAAFLAAVRKNKAALQTKR